MIHLKSRPCVKTQGGFLAIGVTRQSFVVFPENFCRIVCSAAKSFLSASLPKREESRSYSCMHPFPCKTENAPASLPHPICTPFEAAWAMAASCVSAICFSIFYGKRPVPERLALVTAVGTQISSFSFRMSIVSASM